MRYALVNGERQEATQSKLRGNCQNCEREVVAKCGSQRIWHWAHLGKLECDRWWESETEWHRGWKALFPEGWQEVRHVSLDGERHIADVKNDTGLVIELQHSPIDPGERRSRENFYKTMIWVIDGMRFKRDLATFREAVGYGRIVNDNPLYLMPFSAGAAILKRWAPLQCPVFIDFGTEEFYVAGLRVPEPVIWQLLLVRETGQIVVAAVTRGNFIEFCSNRSGLQHLFVTRAQPRQRRTLPQGRQVRPRRKRDG